SVFNEQYESGRRTAVAKQAKEINLKVRFPRQEEIDDKIANWANEKSRFVAGLVKEALPSGTVLFAENREILQTLASKIADQIDLEYRNQRQFVEENSSDGKVPANRVLASQIHAYVTAELTGFVKQMRRQGVPSYGVFKAVE